MKITKASPTGSPFLIKGHAKPAYDVISKDQDNLLLCYNGLNLIEDAAKRVITLADERLLGALVYGNQ